MRVLYIIKHQVTGEILERISFDQWPYTKSVPYFKPNNKSGKIIVYATRKEAEEEQRVLNAHVPTTIDILSYD